MTTVDFAERTLVLNIAYFGALQAGAGSNVRHLHRFLPAREKAELRREGPKDRPERVWWFTYTPPDAPKVPGFVVKVRVAAVPSADEIGLDRDPWLLGLDGVVFVADARAGRGDANLAALLDLERLLAAQGLDVGAIPLVFQVNQADPGGGRPAERVAEDLNPFGFPVIDALARTGTGVIETHDTLLAAVFTRLKDRLADGAVALGLTAVSRAERDRAEGALLAHVAPLTAAAPRPARGPLPATAEIPVRVAELRGSTPLHHVRTELHDARLHVEAVWRRPDGSQRKVAVLVAGGADEPAPVAAPATPPRPVAPPPRPTQREAWQADDLPGELPRLTYGVAGVVGGLVSGLLLGYLWWV